MCSILHLSDCTSFDLELLQHHVSLSSPLPASQHEVDDRLSTVATPPAMCVLHLTDPQKINASDGMTKFQL
jgi:hypothetical protein